MKNCKELLLKHFSAEQVLLLDRRSCKSLRRIFKDVKWSSPSCNLSKSVRSMLQSACMFIKPDWHVQPTLTLSVINHCSLLSHYFKTLRCICKFDSCSLTLEWAGLRIGLHTATTAPQWHYGSTTFTHLLIHTCSYFIFVLFFICKNWGKNDGITPVSSCPEPRKNNCINLRKFPPFSEPYWNNRLFFFNLV